MILNENMLVLMLGGNVGDTFKIFQDCQRKLTEKIGSIIYLSNIYKTLPWGFSDQDPYLNQAIILKTSLHQNQLIEDLQSIEILLGKNKLVANGPRTIDIDVMFWGNLIIETQHLSIPHPRLHLRKFNLIPLKEIIPQYIHPVFGKSISELESACEDTLDVQLLKTA